MRRIGPLLAVLSLVAPQLSGKACAASRIELRVSPLVNLHFYVRSLADSAGAPADLPEIAPAVERALALERELGSPLLWGPIEATLASCETASAARAAFAALPDSMSAGPIPPAAPQDPSVRVARPNRRVAMRAPAESLAAALEAAEPAYLERRWPGQRATVEEALARVTRILVPREEECFGFMEQSLGMRPAELPIPVHLVAEGPFPHGVTHRGVGGRGVCFVSLNGNPGDLLIETILHESLHALDIASPGSVLEDLRGRLEGAGLPRTDRRSRDIPHTLMFIQAAETVRRVIDPEHVPYGEAAGYYARVGAIADVERRVWVEHLDGKLTRERALERIVAETTGPAPSKE